MPQDVYLYFISVYNLYQYHFLKNPMSDFTTSNFERMCNGEMNYPEIGSHLSGAFCAVVIVNSFANSSVVQHLFKVFFSSNPFRISFVKTSSQNTYQIELWI